MNPTRNCVSWPESQGQSNTQDIRGWEEEVYRSKVIEHRPPVNDKVLDPVLFNHLSLGAGSLLILGPYAPLLK